MTHRVVVAIGSNISPKENVALALERLSARLRVVAVSRFVRTAPIGRPGQPDFLNGAVLIETELDRPRLRRRLKRLEREMGRRPSADKYAPRTIDLDIVVWDGEIVDRDVCERPFLQKAILEVWPSLKIE